MRFTDKAVEAYFLGHRVHAGEIRTESIKVKRDGERL